MLEFQTPQLPTQGWFPSGRWVVIRGCPLSHHSQASFLPQGQGHPVGRGPSRVQDTRHCDGSEEMGNHTLGNALMCWKGNLICLVLIITQLVVLFI